MRIGVLNGPNLNLLGDREPAIYGTATLAEVVAAAERVAGELGAEVVGFQSNHEGELIDWVQETAASTDAYVVNAGGYTHTSVALLDALVASGRPFAEVHLSNVQAREPFRRASLLAPSALGVIGGFGAEGYVLAVRGLVHHLQHSRRG